MLSLLATPLGFECGRGMLGLDLVGERGMLGLHFVGERDLLLALLESSLDLCTLDLARKSAGVTVLSFSVY